MHPKKGQIQAYLDQNLPAAEMQEIHNHLVSCPSCQQAAQRQGAANQQLTRHFESLNPRSDEIPASDTSRKRLQTLIQQEKPTMFNKLFAPRMRPVWAVVVIALILTISFSFPQVRALGNSFLGLFRVQQVAVLPVDTDVLADKANLYGENMYNALFEDVTEERLGTSLENTTAEEASAVAGITVRLPEGVQSLSVEQGLRLTLQVDQPLLQSIFDETGLAIDVPKILDGATVTGEIPPAVIANFECTVQEMAQMNDPDDPDDDATVAMSVCDNLLQVASPSIDAPPGLDIAAIGEGFLQVMGMSPEEAANFSQTVDWATTLVIPVPRTASYENVSVDGTDGVLLRESTYSTDGHYILLWTKDDVVYALSGTGSNEEALAIGNSLK